MTQRRCGIDVSGRWFVRLSGDAVDLDPDNVAVVREGDPFGMPIKVWSVHVSWHVHSRGPVPWQSGMSWGWNDMPTVRLSLGYVDADGHYTDPDPDGPGPLDEEVDWSSHTAPAWVRRLVEERVTGPNGEPAVLPPPLDHPAQVCAHPECPAHGSAT